MRRLFIAGLALALATPLAASADACSDEAALQTRIDRLRMRLDALERHRDAAPTDVQGTVFSATNDVLWVRDAHGNLLRYELSPSTEVTERASRIGVSSLAVGTPVRAATTTERGRQRVTRIEVGLRRTR